MISADELPPGMVMEHITDVTCVCGLLWHVEVVCYPPEEFVLREAILLKLRHLEDMARIGCHERFGTP